MNNDDSEYPHKKAMNLDEFLSELYKESAALQKELEDFQRMLTKQLRVLAKKGKHDEIRKVLMESDSERLGMLFHLAMKDKNYLICQMVTDLLKERGYQSFGFGCQIAKA